MKHLKDYIIESYEYNKQCEMYLSSTYNDEIIEEGILDWFKSFVKKTTNFVNKWLQKGNKKINVNAKGKIQQTQKPITQSYNDIKKTFLIDYKQIFPETIKYLNQHQNIRPDRIDKTQWEKITLALDVFTPDINYNGENYPVSVCLYSPNIKILDNYLHLFNFEMSTIVEGVTQKQIFEQMITELFKNKSYDGLTYSSKTVPKNMAYKSASKWETTDVENVFKLVIK